MLRSCVVLAVFLAVVYGIDKDQPCTTPNSKKGQCVTVHNCPGIISAITSKNDTEIEFAKKSQCGFYDSQPLVCCELWDSGSLPKTDVCGTAIVDRLIGGIDTQIAQYTWMAALEFKKKGTDENVGVKCAGTLINNNYVLTSAGCLSDEEFELVQVRLGDWDLVSDPDCEEIAGAKYCSEPVRRFKVNKIIKHPNYDKASGSDDIALIRLEDIVTYSEFISPICLPNAVTPPLSKNTLPIILAGWGTTINSSSSNSLREVHVSLIQDGECKNKIGSNKQLNANQFCEEQTYKDVSCIGSIGSPLMRPIVANNRPNLYLDGILIWNDKCSSNDPGVLTQVVNYVPWILETISKE